MVARCPRCAYRFHRAPGQWLGSWFLNICVVQSVLVVVMLVVAGATWPQTPAALLLVSAAGSALVTPVAFFPFSRTIWVAIDLIMKPLDFDDDVAPGFELERELAALVEEHGQGPAPDPGPPL